jgi:anti-sigma regulatory factor (Ser/Thr protein kinase)
VTGSLRFRIAGDVASLASGQRQLRGFLETGGATESGIYKAELVYDELVTNVMKYAHGPGAASRPIDVGVSVEPAEIVMTVEDDGPPFNPLEVAEPERPKSLEEASPGGLGISMVRMVAAKMEYERRGERNRIRVTISKD